MENEITEAKYLSTRAAADFLGIAKGTLQNWRFFRKGPPYAKLSKGKTGKVMYDRNDLVQFMAERKVKPGN